MPKGEGRKKMKLRTETLRITENFLYMLDVGVENTHYCFIQTFNII